MTVFAYCKQLKTGGGSGLGNEARGGSGLGNEARGGSGLGNGAGGDLLVQFRAVLMW